MADEGIKKETTVKKAPAKKAPTQSAGLKTAAKSLVKVRTANDRALVNPFTGIWISQSPVEIASDSWLESQIEAGVIVKV